jgi:hypothetical protein
VGVGASALNIKNATTDCGASGSGTACQNDLTAINGDLAKVTTQLGNAGTDCTTDFGTKCPLAVANLTATVATASKAAASAQNTCDKNEKTLCTVDLIDASLNIAKAVIEAGDALGDCKKPFSKMDPRMIAY